MLARTTVHAERGDAAVPRNMNLDGAQPTSTPESAKQRSGMRRSLQKTLREAHHHSSSVNKHKRGKESDSTVRSAGRENEVEEPLEGTPGLKREKGRFILHGKQASVVQFGNDWPNERMKARREAWRQNSSSPRDEQRTPRAFGNHGRADYFGPVIHDFTANERPSTSSGPFDTNGFQQDAEAADVYARSASPVDMSSSASEMDDMPTSFSMPALTTQTEEKRSTVIGPAHRRRASLQKGEDGDVVSATEDDAEDYEEESDTNDEEKDNEETPVASKRQQKRSTAIGPSYASQPSVDVDGSDISTQGGAEEDSEDDEKINEDGFRHASPQRAVEVA